MTQSLKKLQWQFFFVQKNILDILKLFKSCFLDLFDWKKKILNVHVFEKIYLLKEMHS